MILQHHSEDSDASQTRGSRGAFAFVLVYRDFICFLLVVDSNCLKIVSTPCFAISGPKAACSHLSRMKTATARDTDSQDRHVDPVWIPDGFRKPGSDFTEAS
jgi:hypothetical protein